MASQYLTSRSATPSEVEERFIARAIEAVNARDLLPAPAGSIVVGDDGSTGAHHALVEALMLARGLWAGVVVVQSWTIDASLGELSDHRGAVRSFAEVTQSLRERLVARRRPLVDLHPGVEVEFRVLLAQPAEALVALSRDAAMLVLGSRGLGPVGGLVLGSVGARCLRRATCPVLVVPHRMTGSD